ncbi:Uncharacterised protein [Mycobacterium tuberculosis]|nr:Uncharacterised protein [Mycobacterium tuberculosis]
MKPEHPLFPIQAQGVFNVVQSNFLGLLHIQPQMEGAEETGFFSPVQVYQLHMLFQRRMVCPTLVIAFQVRNDPPGRHGHHRILYDLINQRCFSGSRPTGQNNVGGLIILGPPSQMEPEDRSVAGEKPFGRSGRVPYHIQGSRHHDRRCPVRQLRDLVPDGRPIRTGEPAVVILPLIRRRAVGSYSLAVQMVHQGFALFVQVIRTIRRHLEDHPQLVHWAFLPSDLCFHQFGV